MCFGLARVQRFASNVRFARKAVANDQWCSVNTTLWVTDWQIEKLHNTFLRDLFSDWRHRPAIETGVILLAEVVMR